MAGIIFPDVAGSILPAIQAKSAQTRNEFEMDRMRRADEADAREQAVAKDIPAALAGDKDALGRVAAVPKYALAIAPMIERMDARHQALLKSGAEWQTRAALGVLNAPPEQKVEAHRMALAEGRQLGFGDMIKDMPEEYTPAVAARWKYHLDKSEPVGEHFKRQDSQLVPPPGGGAPSAAPAPAGGGATPEQQAAFVQTMMPHALEVSKATGVDPRLVIAQSALETGYGTAAPGNNYFGIKSHGQPGGQTLATAEAGPDGALAPTQDSFRTYGSPGESAQDYGKFLQTNGRYAPVLAAKDLPGQIDAMGKSGYATDPNYAAKLRQIAFALPTPQPGQATGPPVQLAGGPQPTTGATPASAAPIPNGMPRTPSGTVIDASIPPPPFMPQGGDQPTGNQPGVMPVPQTYAELNAHPMARELKSLLPPGYVIPVERGTGKIRLQDGILTVLDPQGRPVQVQVPKQVDPKDRQPPAGYAPSPGGGLAFIPGGPADPETIKRNSDVRKTASEKAIPQTVVKGMQENLDALKQIDRAVAALQTTPNSVGGVGSTLAANIPGVGNLQNRDLWGMGDPGGAKVRALIADIGSLKIHDRSGAAVTASEFPRLRPFIPSISDDPATVRTKLENFKAVYAQTLQDTATYYNADNGFKAHKPTEDYLGGGATPEAATPAAPSGPPKPGTVDGGYLFNGGDPGKPENWRKVQ